MHIHTCAHTHMRTYMSVDYVFTVDLDSFSKALESHPSMPMDDQLESHPSMPLLSRVDRLDCLMRYISGKTSFWRSYKFSFGKKKKECMPLDAAVEEAAQSKETLLDRVNSLESRLVQLSLEIESRKSSTSASTSSGGRVTISSYPTFNNPNPRHGRPQQLSQLHQITISESQSDSKRLQQKKQKKKEEASLRKKKFGNTNKSDEKKCKNGKKGNPPSWPHLKMLGC